MRNLQNPLCPRYPCCFPTFRPICDSLLSDLGRCWHDALQMEIFHSARFSTLSPICAVREVTVFRDGNHSPGGPPFSGSSESTCRRRRASKELGAAEK